MLTGIVALAIIIHLPTTEGRAEQLDLLSIYTDPFIVYGYLAGIPFFVGLYKTFRLFGYIGNNKTFSQQALKALRSIQYCAIVQCIMIVIAGIYIRIFHDKHDDPAGFMALCMAGSFIAIAAATAAAVFEKIVQQGITLMAENEQLQQQVNQYLYTTIKCTTMIKFSYTIQYVIDVEKTIGFYEKAFGFARKFITPDHSYAELLTGETTLSFASVSLASSNLKEGFMESSTTKQPFGIEIGFTTNDVEATVLSAVDAGATLLEKPKTKPWGQVVAYVRDPNGFLIEICTPME